jgi:hypothetical protein
MWKFRRPKRGSALPTSPESANRGPTHPITDQGGASALRAIAHMLPAPANSIGVAWLEEDGSIALHLTRTSDGMHVSGMLRYQPTDERYNDVLKHLGGLKPGETKPVPAWD